MKKLKRDRITTSSVEEEKKVKSEPIYYAEIKGGLECHLELLINKISKLRVEDWERAESDENTIFLLSVDSARHQVTIEGDYNLISFSIMHVNNRLLMLGDTAK